MAAHTITNFFIFDRPVVASDVLQTVLPLNAITDKDEKPITWYFDRIQSVITSKSKTILKLHYGFKMYRNVKWGLANRRILQGVYYPIVCTTSMGKFLNSVSIQVCLESEYYAIS